MKPPRITLNTDTLEVKLDGRAVKTPPKEFDILRALASAKGAVLSREKLLDEVWNYDPAARVDTRTVDQHIARLRGRFGFRDIVETVPARGYRTRAVLVENAKDAYGTVEDITRSYGPRPFTTLKVVVAGDMLPTMTKGQKIKVA